MPRTNMNVSAPRFTFLSWAIQIHQSVDGRNAAGNILYVGGQANCRKMSHRARGIRGRDQALFGRKFECQRHPQCHRLAVQQTVGKAAASFERVTKGVAEIEQRPLAGFALVARNDAGLGAAAHCNSVLA